MDTIFIEASRESDVSGFLKRITQALETIATAMQVQEAKTYTWTPEGLPLCPKHGEVMKRREKQGDTWYSHRVIDPATGEEKFCRGYHGKNSPGYDIDTAPTQDDDKPTPPRGGMPPGPQRQPRPAPAKAATYPTHAEESALDSYFPRPNTGEPPAARPNDSTAARDTFNRLQAELITGGRVPVPEITRCAGLANTEDGGWIAALSALRQCAGIAEA